MKINKKLGKVLAIIMILSIFVMSFAPLALATTESGSKGAVPPDKSFDKADDSVAADVRSFGGKIVTIISTVGSIGAVIFLIVLGLKYMMGSAEERAEYKKTLMPYFIGAIMVFGASALAGIIFNIAGGIGGGTTA